MEHTLANSSSLPLIRFNQEFEEYRIVYIILQAITSFVTIFGSSTVLALFYFTKHKGVSRKFFIALTVSDLQCGIICCISFNYIAQGVLINDPYCMKAVAIVHYTLCVALFLLFTMTIDRYFAIIYPVKHKCWSSNTITYLGIGGSWIGGIVMGVCYYWTSQKFSPHPEMLCFVILERTNHIYTLVATFCVKTPCMILFLYAYIKMFKVILNSVSHKVYQPKIPIFKFLIKLFYR